MTNLKIMRVKDAKQQQKRVHTVCFHLHKITKKMKTAGTEKRSMALPGVGWREGGMDYKGT